MKKLGKILIFALSLVIALSAFAIASSADTSPFLVEGLYRESWEEAIENAYIKGDRVVPVELLKDYEANGEIVEITESVVISLNGYTLKSAAGAPLFSVSGKDTTLTIKGPGAISCAGTLVEVQSGALVFDASEALTITSTGSDSVAVVGGGEEEAYASVKGNLDFQSSAGSLFEMASGSEFKLETDNGVSAKPTATATDGFAIVIANSGSKVNVSGGSLANSGGYIFKIGDDTEHENPVSIKCESAVLVSNSSTYGSIVEAGSAYANVDVRYSEVLASGGAFTSDNTLADFEGEGRDKVYAKPTLKVNFVVSTYNVSKNPNANASLFCGNVTGIVVASEIWNTENSFIAINTRLWDGECGVLLKKGNKLSVTSKMPVSDTKAPAKDEDGVTVYFTPGAATNNNFSLETIDGKSCDLYKATDVTADSSIISYYLVTNEISSFVDAGYSSNFNDPNGIHPLVDSISSQYGSIIYETSKDKDGKDNRYFKWEYDVSKNDQYSFDSGGSYFDLDAGGSYGATRGFDAIVDNEYITWDFDITSSNGTYSSANLNMIIRENGGSTGYARYFASITNNTFKLSNAPSAAIPKLPVTPYEWAHITLVLEIDSSGAYEDGGVACYPNLCNSKIHLFYNGVYYYSTAMFSDLIESEDGIKKSAQFSLDAIRFRLSAGPSVDKTKSTSILIDNSIITYYPKGYTGNVSEAEKAALYDKTKEYYNYKTTCEENGVPVAKNLRDFVGDMKITLSDVLINKSIMSIKDACDVVYKKGYRMPGAGVVDTDDRPVKAVVDGVKYYEIEEALRAIVDGSEVYLYTDVDIEYNANLSFTVYTKKEDGGEYKFNVLSDSYYVSEVRENGEVVGYKTLLANTFITVYWQINTGYQTQVPLGIVPTYDWVIPSPSYDEQGRYIELLGWSSDKNATEPEELGSITKDDLIKGYKIYYPVMGVSRVPVSFLDAYGNPAKDTDGNPVVKEIPVGTPEAELNKYFDGSNMPAFQITGNDWYEKCFSAWSIPGDVVGRELITATPEFSEVRIKASAIKTSFSIVRLIDFSPTLYILKPDADSIPADSVDKVQFKGFSFDEKDVLDSSNQYVYDNVKIGDNVYYKLNLSKSGHFGKPSAQNLQDFKVYVHYTYEGVTKVESITLSLSSYLEAAFNAGTNEEKSAIIEIMRLIMAYLELAENTDASVYATCAKYVNDSKYAEYLSEYTEAIDSISSEKKAANATMLESLYEHAEDNIRWNFVTNVISFTPKKEKYPRLTNSWTPAKKEDDGVVVRIVTTNSLEMCDALDKAAGTYTFGLGFDSAKSTRTSMITAYDTSTANNAKDMIGFQFLTEYYVNQNRPLLHTQYYNLTAHITELTRRIDEIKDDADQAALKAELEAELKMAEIILSTHVAIQKCTFESSSNGASIEIPGTVIPPAVALPKR